jgi:hypothetical protein
MLCILTLILLYAFYPNSNLFGFQFIFKIYKGNA